MKRLVAHQVSVGLISLFTGIALYTLISNAYLYNISGLPETVRNVLRPGIIPPTQELIRVFIQLVSVQPNQIGGPHFHGGPDATGGAGSAFVEQTLGGPLQYALLLSSYRVAFGLLTGGALGFAFGIVMGWSTKADDYLHPTYNFLRSIPPLALLSYFMIWFGHNETHRLLPIVYAVFAATVIPTYHGVRDIPLSYLRTAQSLGARGRLLFTRVIVPAASPFVLAGLRYSLMVAWITTVGVEMLMGGDGIGQLIYDVYAGNVYAGGLTVGVDAAGIIVCILSLGVVGYATDFVAKTIAEKFTRWKPEGL